MKTLLILVFCACQPVFAQLSGVFEQIARNEHYGAAMSVALGDDGTVFLANSWGGLIAYEFTGNALNTVTRFDSGQQAMDLALGPDGTLFVANGYDGIGAYIYDGNIFQQVGHIINEGGTEGGGQGIAVSQDGHVFVGNRRDGLRVYSFDGSVFHPAGHADDGSYDGNAYGVALNADGVVFLANGGDGIRAYRHTQDSVYSVAHLGSIGTAYDVIVAPDGTVYAVGGFGLLALEYADTTFTVLAAIDDGDSQYGVAIGEDGTIFTAADDDGLRAFTFQDGVFTPGAIAQTGENARGVAVAEDGTVFVANTLDGLQAWEYSGISFIHKATNDAIGTADGLVAGNDGTVFVSDAIAINSLRAYSFENHQYESIAYSRLDHSCYALALGSDGTLFTANATDGLWAYKHEGGTFTPVTSIDNGGLATDVTVGPDGRVYLANHSGGLWAYTYTGAVFHHDADVDDGGLALGLQVADDGTVFLANGSDGIRVYRYNGNMLVNQAHVEPGYDPMQDVAFDSNGHVFCAGYDGKLYVYDFNGSAFTLLDQTGYMVGDQRLVIDEWGNIFLANSSLCAYTLLDGKLYNTATIRLPKHATAIDLGPDGTIHVACGLKGIASYRYSGPVSVDGPDAVSANRIILASAYPNPFSQTTTITYRLERAAYVTMRFYGVLGRELMVLEEGWKAGGVHGLRLDGSSLPFGALYYRLSTNEQQVFGLIHHVR